MFCNDLSWIGCSKISLNEVTYPAKFCLQKFEIFRDFCSKGFLSKRQS